MPVQHRLLERGGGEPVRQRSARLDRGRVLAGGQQPMRRSRQPDVLAPGAALLPGESLSRTRAGDAGEPRGSLRRPPMSSIVLTALLIAMPPTPSAPAPA